MQMNGADAMIQHAGLNVVSLLKYQSFYICFKTYMPHVLLMNIKYSARYVVPWLTNRYQIWCARRIRVSPSSGISHRKIWKANTTTYFGTNNTKGPRAWVAQWVRQLDYLTIQTNLSPIRRGFAPGFVNCKNGAFDSQPQVIKHTSCLSNGRWFSPGTPVSSTTKAGHLDIAEILLKMALKHHKSNQINQWS